MEFIYSESVPIRKVDNTPLSEDEFYKVLNLAHEAIQCARKQREEVLASCAALRARIVELEDERDRWYGAAHERMIKINGLESTCRVQGQVIADQRARIEVLEKVVDWALTKGCETAQNKGWDAYEKELRRMAGLK